MNGPTINKRWRARDWTTIEPVSPPRPRVKSPLPEPRVLFTPPSQCAAEVRYQQSLDYVRVKLMGTIQKIRKNVQENKARGCVYRIPAEFRIHGDSQDVTPCLLCRLGAFTEDRERCFQDVYSMLAGSGHPVSIVSYESEGRLFRCIKTCTVEVPVTDTHTLKA